VDRECLLLLCLLTPSVKVTATCNKEKNAQIVNFRFLFLCFSDMSLSFQIVSPHVLLWFSFSSPSLRVVGGSQAERPRGGCCCWAGFGLLFWPFDVEKIEEKNVAKEGASVLLGLWALEERLEKGSLSDMRDEGAAAADFYG